MFTVIIIEYLVIYIFFEHAYLNFSIAVRQQPYGLQRQKWFHLHNQISIIDHL